MSRCDKVRLVNLIAFLSYMAHAYFVWLEALPYLYADNFLQYHIFISVWARKKSNRWYGFIKDNWSLATKKKTNKSESCVKRVLYLLKASFPNQLIENMRKPKEVCCVSLSVYLGANGIHLKTLREWNCFARWGL